MDKRTKKQMSVYRRDIWDRHEWGWKAYREIFARKLEQKRKSKTKRFIKRETKNRAIAPFPLAREEGHHNPTSKGLATKSGSG